MKFRSPEKFKNARDVKGSDDVNFEHDHECTTSEQTCHQRGCVSALHPECCPTSLTPAPEHDFTALVHFVNMRQCERACGCLVGDIRHESRAPEKSTNARNVMVDDDEGFFCFFHIELVIAAREEPSFTSELSHPERDVSRVSLHWSLFLLPQNRLPVLFPLF